MPTKIRRFLIAICIVAGGAIVGTTQVAVAVPGGCNNGTECDSTLDCDPTPMTTCSCDCGHVCKCAGSKNQE